MAKKKRKAKPAIGWREWVSIPELGIARVKAKVDTGARSSALHAIRIHVAEENGVEVVRFAVHPFQDDSRTTVHCEAPLLEKRWVTSSNGKRQLRPVIRTTISLDGRDWPIDITLTSRDMMGFRMLLGREAVRKRYVVDPSRSYLAERRKQRKEVR